MIQLYTHHLYKFDLIVFYQETKESYLKYLKKNNIKLKNKFINAKFIKETFEKVAGRCCEAMSENGNQFYVIVINKDCPSIISHEVFHLAEMVFDCCGVSYYERSANEHWAYFIEFFVKVIWSLRNEKKEKKKLSKKTRKKEKKKR